MPNDLAEPDTAALTIRAYDGAPIEAPGIYEMTAAQYHADPVAVPSLSSSIATALIEETPLHAWTRHPRLNPRYADDGDSDAMDKGSVAHELILGKGGGIKVLAFDDWRRKEAREARDAARLDGLTPVLAKAHEEAMLVAEAVLGFLARTEDCQDFVDQAARSELVLVWQDVGGVWCRAMLDRLTPRGVVYDVKTSGRDLGDGTLERKFADGFAMQPGFYLRGLSRLWPAMAGRFRWRWIFAEQTAPFAVRIDEPDATALQEGEQRAELAILRWARCRASGEWPGYLPRVGRIGPNEWAHKRWLERFEIERMAELPRVGPVDDPNSLIFGERKLALEARS